MASFDLSGVWEQINTGFFWERAQLFQRRNSDNPHDYWLVHSRGACLASNCRYLAARYDPGTKCIQLSARAYHTLSAPWWLLRHPSRDDDAYAPLLLNREVLDRLARKCGHRWSPTRCYDWLVERSGDCMPVLRRERAGRGVALVRYPTSHGGPTRPRALLEIEDAELAASHATAPRPAGARRLDAIAPRRRVSPGSPRS